MSNDTLTQKQGIYLIISSYIGTASLMLGMQAKRDIWLASLFAVLFSALVYLIYIRLLRIQPEKDFFAAIEHHLGGRGSKAVILVFSWFAFHSCALALRNLGQLFVTTQLPETPMAVCMFLVMLVCAAAVRRGLETLARFSTIFLLVTIFTLLTILALIFNNLSTDNILPVIDNGAAPVVSGAVAISAFPFLQTGVVFLVFARYKKSASVRKVFLRAILLGGAAMISLFLVTILALGEHRMLEQFFPVHYAIATIEHGNFLFRYEVITALIYIFVLFINLSVLLFGACKGSARLFWFSDHRPFIMPITFLVICYALFSFDNMMYFHEWMLGVFPYYALMFELALPAVLLVLLEIKRKRNERRPLP